LQKITCGKRRISSSAGKGNGKGMRIRLNLVGLPPPPLFIFGILQINAGSEIVKFSEPLNFGMTGTVKILSKIPEQVDGATCKIPWRLQEVAGHDFSRAVSAIQSA
jgi:hypothetical protein